MITYTQGRDSMTLPCRYPDVLIRNLSVFNFSVFFLLPLLSFVILVFRYLGTEEYSSACLSGSSCPFVANFRRLLCPQSRVYLLISAELIVPK